jgi:3'-5' exoribonuclease
MIDNKGCFVKDLKDNQAVKGCFLVKEMTKSETRAGKPFLTLTLMDKTGEITGRVWDNADQLESKCPAGGVVRLAGQSQSYRDNLQLNVKALDTVNKEEVDWTMFMPSSPYDPNVMFAELKNIIDKVDNPDIRGLLLAFTGDQGFVDMLKKAPAAKAMHHAYLGGLLEHTLGVVRLAEKVAELYPEIDRSLLICGAVLHDIGKVKEFSYEIPPFNYSDQGRLVGHMVIAVEIIHEKISYIDNFPEDLAMRIKHLILSHHGCHEFGSPSLPMIREAFVLNFIDDLDAKMNYIDGLNSKVEEKGYQWTPFQRTLERFLFVPGNSDNDPLESVDRDLTQQEDSKTTRQPTLW